MNLPYFKIYCLLTSTNSFDKFLEQFKKLIVNS